MERSVSALAALEMARPPCADGVLDNDEENDTLDSEMNSECRTW
jgi:hypothetical protein